MSDEKEQERPKRLTAQKKFQMYLETRGTDKPVGEILRRYGLHLPDLRAIEEIVENASIEALKVRGNGKVNRESVTPEEYERLAKELREKEKALADLTVEHQLLKKVDSLGLWRKKGE